MQETLNIGAGRAAADVQRADPKPVRGRGRGVERHSDRKGPAFVDKVRKNAPGVRKLAQSVAAAGKEARANQQATKAIASAQRQVEKLQQVALAQRGGEPSANRQIEAAGQFAAAEHDLAAIVESIPAIGGDLLPPLALGSEEELAATISQLQAAGERLVVEKNEVEARQKNVEQAVATFGNEPGAIDEVSAREIVNATAQQIERNQEAALNSHASAIIQEAIRAFS